MPPAPNCAVSRFSVFALRHMNCWQPAALRCPAWGLNTIICCVVPSFPMSQVVNVVIRGVVLPVVVAQRNIAPGEQLRWN